MPGPEVCRNTGSLNTGCFCDTLCQNSKTAFMISNDIFLRPPSQLTVNMYSVILFVMKQHTLLIQRLYITHEPNN